MANGELWIAKEIYRRELLRIQASTPEQKQDEKYTVITQWLDSRVKELEKICK